MLKRIAITGPESTGKTQLAKELAAHFQANWVPEFAREYLSAKSQNYEIEDIIAIAQGQLKSEEKAAKETTGFLFCDTDFTVLKIWSQEVFTTCPHWIEEKFVQHSYDLYLLCYPDLDWEADPLRENPTDSLRLFKRYKNELKKASFNYAIVKGSGEARLKNAINFVMRLNGDL
jgi:NadR type nicotinamide-nucleotide adenylyltransferase